MDEMGMNIDKIAANAENMNNYSEEMRVSCDQTVEALNRLSEQSDDTAVAIRNIGESIRTTNESVSAIAEAAGAIEGIATQTNLLALNASIEAARAGEQGRGFAVVASEIGALAAQSKDATKRIEEIVKALVEQSEENITTMQGLDEGMTLQMEQLDNTKNNMNSMAANVNNVSDGMEEVAESIEHLKKAKDAMVEIVEGLSAISEENAASTEETRASMLELADTVRRLSEKATGLNTISKTLEEEMSFFS
jgi:methyl-accepting chemotaxis protein